MRFTINPAYYYGTTQALHAWYQGQDGDRDELERLERNLISACERYFVPEPQPYVGPSGGMPLSRACTAKPCGKSAVVVIITAPDYRLYACAEHAEWLLAALERPA